MNFNQYQAAVADMPLYDDPILGLCGEVGEVVEHVKKSRRPEPKTKAIDPVEFAKELGDVLWYLTRLAENHGLLMSDIAELNIRKLEKRHAS
jgi:NTP pyrophosphatase (non-canonical NTP hydrolase)